MDTQQPEVIDLSDDGEGPDPNYSNGQFLDDYHDHDYGGPIHAPAAQPDRLDFDHNWNPDSIDLTGSEHATPSASAKSSHLDVPMDVELLTIADCLQRVMTVFPDISLDHVLQLIADQTQDDTRTIEACGRIITQLLDGEAYPKEDDLSRKRKRGRSLSRFEDDDGTDRTEAYKNDA